MVAAIKSVFKPTKQGRGKGSNIFRGQCFQNIFFKYSGLLSSIKPKKRFSSSEPRRRLLPRPDMNSLDLITIDVAAYINAMHLCRYRQSAVN